MKQVVITWGFNPHNGDWYLDNYLELDHSNPEESIFALKMIQVRMPTQGTRAALFQVPDKCDRDDIDRLMKSYSKDKMLGLLTKAHVHLGSLYRKGSESNAVNVLLTLENKDENLSRERREGGSDSD